jgi:hypothetical protein
VLLYQTKVVEKSKDESIDERTKYMGYQKNTEGQVVVRNTNKICEVYQNKIKNGEYNQIYFMESRNQ